MADIDKLILQSIYDTLFSAYADPPAELKLQGVSQNQNVYLSLNWPGQALDIASFANPQSPTNPTGDVKSLQNFSTMVDKLFSINPITAENGYTLSQGIYPLTLKAQVTPPPVDEYAKKRYEEAFNYLHTDGTDFDGDGKPIPVKVDSPVYANYKRKMEAYNTALNSLLMVYFGIDLKDPAGQRQWSLMGPGYISKVNSAYQDWVNAQKSRVEDMLAVESQYINNQVGLVFSNANVQYENYARADVFDPTKKYWPAYAIPANWFAPAAADTWTSVTLDSKTLKTNEHSDFSKITAGGDARWGLWHVGGSFDKEDSHVSMNKQTTNIKVSFKFTRVQINRPWYNHLLYSVRGWSLGNSYGKGGLSNGTRNQPLNTPFPMLPTGFIAVRDLAISADFSKEEAEMITSKLQTKVSFGWGPFAISGGYAHGSSDKKFASSFDGKTIRNDGLQIIGWINTIVPECPPQ
ncbi:hypothetical protein [Proteiniphilum sp.]|nr:hypothetical protein [Proteiniphilum sp.]MEA4916324.1 hypothetical protein [Proteiniphilum sp.]